jgi:DNA-binding transcriptional MerR regulator
MRLSELAAATGIPVATVKYYLREGLMPPGRNVTATRADYGAAHVRRAETIQTLRKVVGLSVAQVRAIVALIDEGADRIEIMKGLQSVIQGLGAPAPGRTEGGNRVVAVRGWPDVPTAARAALDDHLDEMARLGVAVPDSTLEAYSAAVDAIARIDVGSAAAEDLEGLVTSAAVGMHMNAVLVQRLLALAQTSRSIMSYGQAAPGPSRLSPPAQG